MILFKKKDSEKKFPEIHEMSGMPTFPEIPRGAGEARPEREEFDISSFPEPPRRVAITPTIMPFEPIRRDISEERETVKEPVFVKINKYREALSSFEIVKKKLQETSNILERIRELKQKEDEEIEKWNQELASLKEKINAIEGKLFLRD